MILFCSNVPTNVIMSAPRAQRLFRLLFFELDFFHQQNFFEELRRFSLKIELDNQKYRRPVVKNLLLRLVFSQFDLYHLKLETRILWHTTSKSEKKCWLSSLDCLSEDQLLGLGLTSIHHYFPRLEAILTQLYIGMYTFLWFVWFSVQFILLYSKRRDVRKMSNSSLTSILMHSSFYQPRLGAEARSFPSWHTCWKKETE